MKSSVLSSIAVLTLLACDLGVAQDGVANFSGTWQKDPSRSETLAQTPEASAQTPLRLVIKQLPGALQIDRQRDGQSASVTYAFNSEPARPTTPDPPTAEPPVGTAGTTVSKAEPDLAPPGVNVTESRAEWKDGRLILSTVLFVNGKAVTTTEALTLSADGRELIVQTNLQMHHGYDSRKAAAAAEGKDVYIRAID